MSCDMDLRAASKRAAPASITAGTCSVPRPIAGQALLHALGIGLLVGMVIAMASRRGAWLQSWCAASGTKV